MSTNSLFIFMSGRKPNAVARFITVGALLLTISALGFAQKRGKIAGTIKRPTAGVVVIATNQVTGKVTRARAMADGRYAMKLTTGAYRLSVDAPYIAKFDKPNSYGEHALIRDDSLENVIVSEGKETTIDFTIEKREEKPVRNVSAPNPVGAAGKPTVES